MKLKDLKKRINKLSKEQLEQDFIVIASQKTLSGFGEARVSNANLINTGDDDPCELVTKQSLIADGYEKEEIKEYEYRYLEMWLEGSADNKPSESEIIEYAKARGFELKNIKIWFDNFQKFWRFNADLVRL